MTKKEYPLPPTAYLTGRASDHAVYVWPHMCRMDHVAIGHMDSENEQCPLCLASAEVAKLREVVSAVKEAKQALKAAVRYHQSAPDGDRQEGRQIGAVVEAFRKFEGKTEKPQPRHENYCASTRKDESHPCDCGALEAIEREW